MAPLCRYWAKGGCRNGENCKFDHPRDLPRNDNRFAGFQSNDHNPRNGSGRSNGDGRSTPPNLPYSLNKDQIIADLSKERPQWILSAYGPGLRAPVQLFGGPLREQSFEEMRLHYYQGAASGTEAVALQQAESLVREAESQMRNAINDVDGAIEFVRSAQNQHPNRLDICRTSTDNQASVGSFSNIPSDIKMGIPVPPTSGFGQPSALGTRPNPFFAPPRDPALESNPNTKSGFSNFSGQTNPFTAPQIHLGQPLSQPWSNPIGTAVNSQTQQNPFAAISQASPAMPMVEATDTGSSNLHGYGGPLTLPNPLSQRSTTTNGTKANPFSRTSQEGNQKSNGIGGAGPYLNNAGLPHAPLESYMSHSADNKLLTFNAKSVIYKDGEAGFRGRGGTWEKILFPGGAPTFYGATEMEKSAYTTDIEASYLHMRETGSYKDGVMPFIPPKREWCGWDF